MANCLVCGLAWKDLFPRKGRYGFLPTSDQVKATPLDSLNAAGMDLFSHDLVINQSLEFMASFPVFTICTNSLLPLTDSLHCLLPQGLVRFTNSI